MHKVAALQPALRLGYVEGKNIVIEIRVTGLRPELIHEAADDLVRRHGA